MSQQAPIFRNNRFHHFLKLSIARESTGLRPRPDGGFDEIFLREPGLGRIGFLDGPLGVGNLLPFSKPHCYGDKLHYETPMAGDRSIFARHHRKLLHPSSRSFFLHQVLPVRPVPASAIA